IKFLWNYAGNTLINQHSDINKTHEILQDEAKCEMIVVIDNFMIHTEHDPPPDSVKLPRNVLSILLPTFPVTLLSVRLPHCLKGY
ncbi:hypothetical protein MJN54_32495, partial [Salmonella enterica subsp. enterica serovar Kentucky]|nr:hypothetical protein [Salmonella enterica subsp. enterica serovar Kentucky]